MDINETIYIVQVHMPHQTISMPFDSYESANTYFCSLLDECANRYGYVDAQNATLEHCKTWGRYEIYNGYYIQLYQAQLNKGEDIKWL